MERKWKLNYQNIMSKEILVVDDNSDIRSLISSILEDKGFSVRAAANFDQALLEINKKMPDLAVIDVKLDKGDNDGLELLVHIKKKDEDVPVIIPPFGATCANSIPLVRIVGVILLSVLYEVNERTCGLKSPVSL